MTLLNMKLWNHRLVETKVVKSILHSRRASSTPSGDRMSGLMVLLFHCSIWSTGVQPSPHLNIVHILSMSTSCQCPHHIYIHIPLMSTSYKCPQHSHVQIISMSLMSKSNQFLIQSKSTLQYCPPLINVYNSPMLTPLQHVQYINAQS